jgi:hypothetical protein
MFHPKSLIFLSDFDQNLILKTDLTKQPQYDLICKCVQWEQSRYIRTDRQTYRK